MRIPKRPRLALTLLFSSLTLGSLLAAPMAALADDLPIVVHKPIITKDPPKPSKGDGEVSGTTMTGGEGQR